jgi:hypothetical protein
MDMQETLRLFSYGFISFNTPFGTCNTYLLGILFIMLVEEFQQVLFFSSDTTYCIFDKLCRNISLLVQYLFIYLTRQ